MLIKNLDRCYEVIQKQKSTGILELYTARNLEETSQNIYTVICVKDRELARKLVPVTTKKNTSISFQDLRDSFNIEGKYYIVFRYAQGEPLQQALLANEYSLPERLLILKNIFSQLFLQNMPECFIYEVLRKDNIVVNQALEVRFRYFFTEVDYYWQVGEAHCLRRMSELALELFQKELTEKKDKELTEFVKNLTNQRFEDLWDCYEACNNLYEHLLEKSEREELKPGRIWWRAWEAFKKKLPVLKAFLAVLLILASFAFLLWNLPNPAISEDGITFQQIGTLKLGKEL